MAGGTGPQEMRPLIRMGPTGSPSSSPRPLFQIWIFPSLPALLLPPSKTLQIFRLLAVLRRWLQRRILPPWSPCCPTRRLPPGRPPRPRSANPWASTLPAMGSARRTSPPSPFPAATVAAILPNRRSRGGRSRRGRRSPSLRPTSRSAGTRGSWSRLLSRSACGKGSRSGLSGAWGLGSPSLRRQTCGISPTTRLLRRLPGPLFPIGEIYQRPH